MKIQFEPSEDRNNDFADLMKLVGSASKNDRIVYHTESKGRHDIAFKERIMKTAAKVSAETGSTTLQIVGGLASDTGRSTEYCIQI